MVSAVAVAKLFQNTAIKAIDHDPGATTAILASPDGGTTPVVQDMRDYDGFAVIAKPNIVGGTGLTLLEIVASTVAAMTSPVVIKTSGAVAADALIDYVALECLAMELAQAGTDLRYVAARLTMGTSTDEATVVYIAHMAQHPQAGLTATTIS